MTGYQFTCPHCFQGAELSEAQYIGIGDTTTDLQYFFENGCHRAFCSTECALAHYRAYYRSYSDLPVAQQGVGDGGGKPQIDDLRLARGRSPQAE